MANEFASVLGFLKRQFKKAGADPDPWLDLTGYSGGFPSGITPTTAVASQVEMLALSDNPGQKAVRTDLGEIYMQVASPASNINNWQLSTANVASEISAVPLAPLTGTDVQTQLDQLVGYIGVGGVSVPTGTAALVDTGATKVLRWTIGSFVYEVELLPVLPAAWEAGFEAAEGW